jgi:aldose 1-epimerase
MTARLLLANDRFELELEPARGGAVTGFRRIEQGGGRTPVLRDAPDPIGHMFEAAAFPLTPYCNRVRDGRFTFRGREVVLPPTIPTDANALHGDGWLGHWQTLRIDAVSAELAYRHDGGPWPWAYEARQDFRLDDAGLGYRLLMRNLADSPMPAGLGVHPYFPCDAKTVLSTGVESVWTVDKAILPVARVEPTGKYDLHERLIDRADLDNGYGGWRGEARIDWPGRNLRLRMSSPDARFFQVWSPPTGGVFAAEPVTHANAALNEPEAEWPDLGLKVLAPGEAIRLDVRFDVSACD